MSPLEASTLLETICTPHMHPPIKAVRLLYTRKSGLLAHTSKNDDYSLTVIHAEYARIETLHVAVTMQLKWRLTEVVVLRRHRIILVVAFSHASMKIAGGQSHFPLTFVQLKKRESVSGHLSLGPRAVLPVCLEPPNILTRTRKCVAIGLSDMWKYAAAKS